MSILNMVAAAAGGGLEYEEGTFTIPNTSTMSYTIDFSNSHDNRPALVIAESTDSTSTSYTTLSMGIVYGLLFGSPRGGNGSYYAQKIAGRGFNTDMKVTNSWSESDISDSYITSSSARLVLCGVTYPFAKGNWKWIAIWK